MPAASVTSAFDSALWFMDRALSDREYLPPQKPHRLVYLAQAYFSVLSHGQALMPAVSVAEEMGPVEPNIYRAFDHGCSSVDACRLPEEAFPFMTASGAASERIPPTTSAA